MEIITTCPLGIAGASKATELCEGDTVMHLQTGTAIRESIYTGSYLGLCPVLKSHIDQMAIFRDGPPGTSLVLSGASAGLFASLVTQPIDTAKTRMQAFIDPRVCPYIV